MKTIKLYNITTSMDELLAIARREGVLLVSRDRPSFVLEEADDFEREVAQLGNSGKFMKFLKERSHEKSATSIEQLTGELNSIDV